MSSIRILVIEDEPLHQENLYMILDQMSYELIGIAENKKEAMGLFFSTRPDLILMDIALEGERDGIELSEKINTIRPTPIIFTTSFKEPAIIAAASATNPYAYLTKPYKAADLQAAIELSLYKFARDQEKAELEDGWEENWDKDVLIKDSFFTKQAGRLVKIIFQEILWIEVLKDKYLKIVGKNDEFIVRSTLKEITPKLPPNNFIRVHRSFIINAPYVESIDDTDGILYINGKHVPIGRTYRENIIKKINLI